MSLVYKNYKISLLNYYKSQYSGEEMGNNILKADVYKIVSEEEVDCINCLQAKYSTRHIFSQSNDFDKVKKLIEEGDVLSGEDIVKLKSSTLHVGGDEYIFKMEHYPFYQDDSS